MHRLRPCIAGLCLALTPTAASAAESVQALRYGTTVYHFYQQNYFDALTELMIAQRNGVLGAHADSAELLRGGMSLSYGMDRQAEEVFTAYLARPEGDANHDRAWFYLAKMAWQRGELERSATAMRNITELDTPALAEELSYLRAQLNIEQGNNARARDYLALLPADSNWLPYHYYNMGARSAAAGDWSGATRYFQTFDQLDIRDEEAKLLRDRAYAASGFASLSVGDYAGASRDFTRVRLDSPMAEQALLGYGWAESARQEYPAALSPWKTLSQQPPLSQSVRESLLAIPYAWEQLGREGVALASYREAARVFESELESIRDAIVVFSDSDLPPLLELEPGGADSWLAGNDILPVNPQTPYLQQLISSHAFQGAVKELRDLHHMELRLAHAAERMEILRQVDADQQESWAELIRQDREAQLQKRHTALQGRLEQLREKVSKAEAENDGRALADTRQLALWARVDRASSLLGKLERDPEREQQLALLRGLMIWDDSEAFPGQLWAARQQLRELEQLAQQASDSLRRLEQTVAEREHSSFAPRIALLQQRLEEQSKTVTLAIAHSSEQVRRVAVAELKNQERQLSRSLGQSKLAVARLYDKGSMGYQP
jgi:tetratricopeptide (TPR) repeat protein